MLEDSLGSYDRTVLGSFDVTKDEGSTLGVSPGFTEGEVLGSEEGMVHGTGEALGYILVAVDNVKFGLDDRADLGSLTSSLEGSNFGIPKGALFGVPIEEPSCGALILEPFLVLYFLLQESTLNPSYGSPDGPPGGSLLGASLEEILQKAS